MAISVHIADIQAGMAVIAARVVVVNGADFSSLLGVFPRSELLEVGGGVPEARITG